MDRIKEMDGLVARRGAGFFVRAEPSGSEGGYSEDVKNREGEASGSATDIAVFCGDMCGICKKSLKIIKHPYALFSFIDMLFSPVKKLLLLSVCTLSVASCSYTMEEAAYNFEDRLESFINKPMQEVIRRCGTPTRYLNDSDVPGDTSGTYMIYSYKRLNSECEIILKYQKRTMKIIDWDYSGYCLNTNKFRMDDGCFGL